MKKTILILLLLVIAGGFSSAETAATVNGAELFSYPSTLSVKNSKGMPVLLKSDKESRPIILRTVQFANLLGSGYPSIKITDFPVSPTENKNVVLKRVSSVIDETTTFHLMTTNGRIEMPPVQLTTYYGQIEGVENSRVFLNYSNNLLYTIIEYPNGDKFNLTPVLNSDSKDGAHILTNPVDNNRKPGNNPFVCMTEDYNGPKTEASDNFKNKDVVLAPSKLLEIGIICDGTSEYYSMCGKDYDRAVGYMAAVIAVSSQIYENDLNVKIKINEFQIWDDPASDPYKNANLLSDKLNLMPGVWSISSSKRALVVLFANLYAQAGSTQVAGISMGGEPNVGSLCSPSRGYCVFGIRTDGKFPTMNYNWDVNCATHEMGHNFSSPHTHNCYFEPNMIDTCITKHIPIEVDGCLDGNPIPRPGTIMSYCHLTNSNGQVPLFFHPRCIKLMRTAVESAACAKDPAKPTLKLLAPLGQSSYDAKQQIQIRWVYSNVTLIGIKYTSDNGVNWAVVKENIAVTDSIYLWTLPVNGTKSGKIWIYSMSDATVGDTSWNTFNINAPLLSVKKPVQGGKYGNRALLSIEWEEMLVPQVEIDFSTNGGQSWEAVASKQSGGQYSWNVSAIESNNCKIKLTSSDNPNTSVESGIFAIGKEKASMIYPKGGEVWCGSYSYYINWTSDFVDNVVIEYTLDNGTNWKKIRLAAFDGSATYYLWKLPTVNQTTNNVKLRIYPSSDKQTILALSNDFTIDTCLKSQVDDSPVYPLQAPLQIVDIIPNPVNRFAKIKLVNNIGVIEQVEISLFDEKGALVGLLGKFNLTERGEQLLEVSIPAITNGTYILNVQSGSVRQSRKLQISN